MKVTMPRNELTVADNIERAIVESPNTVFPLMAQHRKELRHLRDENIGNLRTRLTTIKQLKREEFIKAHEAEIRAEMAGQEAIAEQINSRWLEAIKRVDAILKSQQEFEKERVTDFLDLYSPYDSVLHIVEQSKERKYSVNVEKKCREIASRRFDEKFTDAFSEASKRIDDIYTKYEESINFGDLSIVKQCYFIMKQADGFFTKIEQMQV
jgi:hypothetical protein